MVAKYLLIDDACVCAWLVVVGPRTDGGISRQADSDEKQREARTPSTVRFSKLDTYCRIRIACSSKDCGKS